MASQSPNAIFEKVREVFYRDAKRNSMLVGLLAVMIVLWGRLLFTGPASATASLLRRSLAVVAEPPIVTSHLSSSTPVLDWLGRPRRIVDRNLFAIHLDYYAKAVDRKTGSGSEETAFPSDTDTEQKRNQQILLENLQSQVTRLKLQTTLLGSTPKAMVNGQLLGIGDSVEGFCVTQIQARRIFVQQDGVTLEVPMQ